MAALHRQLLGTVPGETHTGLGPGDGRGGFHGNSEDNGHGIGDPAQNAAAVVEAINQINGLHASATNNKISLNTDDNEINIVATSAQDSEALANVGLKVGKYKSYSALQKSLFNIKNVQSATDSESLYNGATIKRPSNTIDDIVGGLTIDLQKVSEEGK